MESLTRQISKIPKSTLIESVGKNIVRAISEFENTLTRSDIAQIAIDLYGFNIFKKTSLFKNILYTLDNDQLETLNDSLKVVSSIDDYESFRFRIIDNSYGKNKFTKEVLKLFDEDIDQYFNDIKSNMLSSISLFSLDIFPSLSANKIAPLILSRLKLCFF